jgi:hypothetical protein
LPDLISLSKANQQHTKHKRQHFQSRQVNNCNDCRFVADYFLPIKKEYLCSPSSSSNFIKIFKGRAVVTGRPACPLHGKAGFFIPYT